MEGGLPIKSRDGWNRTSVLPRLMVSPKRRYTSANLSNMPWRAGAGCAMRTQSSVKRASRMILSIVFVLALRLRRSKRDPSSLYLRITPFSMSLMAWLRTQVKNRSKSMGARTHPCFTPLEKNTECRPRRVPHHVVVDLADQGYKFPRAAKYLEDHSQRFSVDGVKRLRQVNEDRIQVLVLLSALLLDLTNRKYHVCGAAVGAEATLCLWHVRF